MACLFVSDLHLSHERPAQLELFRRFMAGPARLAGTIYILGDLVEVWAGDDDRSPPHPLLVDILSSFTAAGGRLYVMRGNRDFLIGRRFCTDTGAHLLDDPTVIELNGTRTLLTHGDRLCTRDVRYQRYRRLVRTPLFRQSFLAIPAFIRVSIAHGFRRLTRRLSHGKSPTITDVDQQAVEAEMRRHDAQLLIHGHTHRPGIHEFSIDGEPARRIVIGDWYEQDSVLVSDEKSERLVRVRDLLQSDL